MNAARLLPAATVVATLLLFVALYYNGATLDGYWSPEFRRDTLLHLGGGVLLALAMRVWDRDRLPLSLAGFAALYVIGGVGIMQGAAALLFAVASLLLGRRVLALLFPGKPATTTTAFVCGLAFYLAVFSLMIHFPVNYRAVYVLLIAAPVVAGVLAGQHRTLLQQVMARAAVARQARHGSMSWIYATAIIAAVLVARFAFLPTLAFDDNALHLRLWAQLRYEHVAAFDYIAQVWEVAPFLVDLMHAAINLVAGADARGATNLMLLAVLLRQLWVVLGALSLDANKRLLVLALFLSTPMTGYLLLVMQTELFMAVLGITGVRLILELRGNWCGPQVAALLAIAAMACATKLPGAVLGLALLAAALLRLWSIRGEALRPSTRDLLMLLTFTLLLATMAFNSYVTAWIKTGNPVFPLYNAIFQSPYFDAYNFTDERWIKGFSFTSYWNLFFDTSGFNESRDFVAGFQYLLLLPLGLITLLALRGLRAQAATLLVPLFGFGLVMFAATQYWRYEFPVLPLATVVIAALLAPQYSRAGAVLVRAAFVACIALNVAFYPGISAYMEDEPGRAYTRAGKQQMMEDYVPGRLLTEWVNRNAPGSNVLYPDLYPLGAMLHGTPVYVTWYSPRNDAAFDAVLTEADGIAFLRERQIDYVVAHMYDPGLPGTKAWSLRRFLSRVGVPVLQINDHILYRVDVGLAPYTLSFELNERTELDATPRLLGTVTTDTASAARYSVEFACGDDAGYFVAQINWNNGQFYYHPVPCSSMPLQFAEGFPIPPGATGGELYGYVSETSAATLTRLSLETLE